MYNENPHNIYMWVWKHQIIETFFIRTMHLNALTKKKQFLIQVATV